MFGCCNNRPARPALRLLFKLAVLVLIFSAGGVSGFLYGINFSFREMRFHAEHMDELPDHAIPRMAEDLALTPEQLPEFERIFRKYHTDIATAEGQAAARAIAVDLLGTLHAAVGDLDQVKRIVKVMSLVNSAPTFTEQHLVTNGCSELLVQVFGPEVGAHARSAFGVAQIPLGACVEIELIAEVR